MLARISKCFSYVIAAGGLMALQVGSIALAETEQEIPFEYQGVGFSYAVAGISQRAAVIDGGGSYSTSSLLMRLSVMKLLSKGTMIGFGVGLDDTRYDFADLSVFGGQAPWDRVRNINFSLPIITRLDRNWSFLISPSIGVFKETDASTSDALAYGAVLVASYRFEDTSRIGVGLGVYDRLDETRLFPFLSINLHLTDNLRLGNPLRAGPTGPAGLELAYKFGQSWEVAIGRAFRSYRFRLNDEGPAPGGIGTQRGQLTFLRLSNQLQSKLRLDLHAGAVFNGDLTVQNSTGDAGVTANYDTAPILAVNLNGRF